MSLTQETYKIWSGLVAKCPGIKIVQIFISIENNEYWVYWFFFMYSFCSCCSQRTIKTSEISKNVSFSMHSLLIIKSNPLIWHSLPYIDHSKVSNHSKFLRFVNYNSWWNNWCWYRVQNLDFWKFLLSEAFISLTSFPGTIFFLIWHALLYSKLSVEF